MRDPKLFAETLVTAALRREAEHVDWKKDYESGIFGVSSAGFCPEKDLLSRRYMQRSEASGKMLMGTITHHVLDDLVGKECVADRARHPDDGGNMIFEHRLTLPMKWDDGCEAIGVGHIDAVFVRYDGDVHLWDFKTTERMTMAPDLKAAYDMQVNIYRGLWDLEFPKTPVTRAFLVKLNFQFKPGQWQDAVSADPVEHNPDAINFWKDRVHFICKCLKDDTHTCTTGSGWECKSCHVKDLCPSPDIREKSTSPEVKRIA